MTNSNEVEKLKPTLPVLDDTLYWEMNPQDRRVKREVTSIDMDRLIAELEAKKLPVSESLRRTALAVKLEGYRQQAARRRLEIEHANPKFQP